MCLLMIILKDETLIRKVIGALLELEVLDATVLDGEGVENLAVRTIPLFDEVGSLFGQSLVYNRTILAHVPERSLVDELVRLCRRDGVDLTDRSIACVLTVPCERYAEGA